GRQRHRRGGPGQLAATRAAGRRRPAPAGATRPGAPPSRGTAGCPRLHLGRRPGGLRAIPPRRLPARRRQRGPHRRPVARRAATVRGVPAVKEFAPFIVAGIATGAIYGLAAAGLVLTYKTSGIFNFAHGAVAAAAAYIFYELHGMHDVPWGLAAVVSVLVFAPLLGLALEL